MTATVRVNGRYFFLSVTLSLWIRWAYAKIGSDNILLKNTAVVQKFDSAIHRINHYPTNKF